jgi:hypothetical protein
LNGPVDTCKCDYAHDPGQTRTDNYECYIDMQCDDQHTWQEGECRVRPGHSCTWHLASDDCTNGFKCEDSIHTGRTNIVHFKCTPTSGRDINVGQL